MSGLSQDDLRHAIATARDHGFKVVKLRFGDEKFRAVLGERSTDDDWADASDIDIVEDAEAGETGNHDIKAPVVGYFRTRAKPLEAGERVEPGDVLCEIVALGIANDVVSKVSGEIVNVQVHEGEPVEYGQVLATVKSL